MSSSADSTASSCASFTLNDGPVFMEAVSLVSMSDKEKDNRHTQSALICAVTSKGHLHLFMHQLNDVTTTTTNKLKKPLKALNQIQIESNQDGGGAPLKIYAAYVCNAQSERVSHIEVAASAAASPPRDLASLLEQSYLCIVYGSPLAPCIERLKFATLSADKVTLLKRDDPSRTNVTLQTESTKIETPGVARELKVLVPGYAAPQLNKANGKRKSVEPSEVKMRQDATLARGLLV